MKIIALSDLHGNLPEIDPSADLVLIAGDICSHGKPHYQLKWLETYFKPWLNKIQAPVIGVAGNHDWPFYKIEYPYLRKDLDNLNLKWTYLEDSQTIVNGLKIWGTPWQRKFYDWAFNLKPEDLKHKWELIPDDTDILVCHGPPYGYGDLVERNENVGCPYLLDKIKQIQPKLVVFGHIHSGYGNWELNKTKLANVTILNEQYKMTHQPTEFEIVS